MKLRVARHTLNLENISRFYTRFLGMQALGSFTGHNGYDGIFLGLPGTGWHLEFTVSADAPVHKPDEDDLLVFYPDTAEQFNDIIERFKQAGAEQLTAKNPYWQANAITYADPDGFRVAIVSVC